MYAVILFASIYLPENNNIDGTSMFFAFITKYKNIKWQIYNLERAQGIYIMRTLVILSHHYLFFVANGEKVSAIYLKSYNCIFICDENVIACSTNISSFWSLSLPKLCWDFKKACLDEFAHC